jgi:hypothetical protein
MKYSMFSRFRTVGKKPATTKLPSQKAPIKRDPFMELIQKEKSVKQLRQSFGDAPNKLPLMSLTQERIAKLARQKESLKMKSNIFRVRKAIKNVYPSGLKGINNPRKLAQAKRLEVKAFTSATKSGINLQKKLSEKTGVSIRKFGSKPVAKNYMSNTKAQELGFPERESIFKKKFDKSKTPQGKIEKLQNLLSKPKYKKQQKLISSRISSLKYEQKVSNIYQRTKGASYDAPFFTTDAAKKARLERLFSGKSFIKRKK